MNELAQRLCTEYADKPAMQLCDVYKFAYQAALGGGHLLTDPAKARQWLQHEWAMTPAEPQPVTQPLSRDWCRLSLAGAKSAGVPEDLCWELFAQGMAAPCGAEDLLCAAHDTIQNLCQSGALPFAPQKAQAFYQAWLAAGRTPFSHSPDYRAAYAPAYRVVRAEDALLLDVLLRLWPLRESGGAAAIEGRCGSGKTTVARRLAKLCGAPVVQMDHFFLPPQKRTEARYAEPGGNVDYERFADEVLSQLHTKKGFSYGRFSCAKGAFDGEEQVAPSPLVLVEGSYAMHPFFGSPYDVTVFCDVDPDTQKKRILARNGPEMLQRFEERWIPMEEAYFKAFSIAERCDFILRPGE